MNHIGVRAGNAKRAVDFYRDWGFEVILEVDFDAVTIIKNARGVELNLITNGVGSIGGKNIMMDVPEKHPRYTHVALRVDSILQCLAELQRHEISVRVAARTKTREIIGVWSALAPREKITPSITFYES